MGLRSFTAPDGSKWQAWEVVPPRRFDPPRLGERRGQDVLRYTGPERRKGERRRAPPPPEVVAPGYERGWLCFQWGKQKRRLAPVPDGWEGRADAELVELWRRARPVFSGGRDNAQPA